MSDYTEEEIQKFESSLKLYVKKESADLDDKLKVLDKRDRRLYYFLIANFVAAFFFAYSYAKGLSTLSGFMYIIILGIFILNVFLLWFQRKQIGILKNYLSQKKN